MITAGVCVAVTSIGDAEAGSSAGTPGVCGGRVAI